MKVIIFIAVACFTITTVLSLPIHELNDTLNSTTSEYNVSGSQPTVATLNYNLTNNSNSSTEESFINMPGSSSRKESNLQDQQQGNANIRPSPSSPSPELPINENATILNLGGSATSSIAVIKPPEIGGNAINLENPSSSIFLSKPPGLTKPHRPFVLTKIKPVWSIYEVLQNRNRNKPFYYYQPESQLPQDTTTMYEMLQNTNRNKPIYYYQPETQLSATQLSQLSQLSQVSQDTSVYGLLQNTNRLKPIYYEPQTQGSQENSMYELPNLKNQYYSESQDSSASVIQNDNSLSNIGGGGGGGVNAVNLAITPNQIQTVQLTT